MARIAGVDLPRNKRMEIALTYIYGIGRALHEDPQVPNFGKRGRGRTIATGMVLAIEPMVNAGSPAVKVDEDGWTARTADGRRSAHFEHTVAVTKRGPEILTRV